MPTFTQPQSDPIEYPEVEYLCAECLTGVLHLRPLTYHTWLHDELITVQNFPAWVCDRCGRREYDPTAINMLNAMLNPSAGQRPRPRRRINPDRQPRPRT